jgi:alkylation response protein AidB-like acyl-CoA dehydrogenase
MLPDAAQQQLLEASRAALRGLLPLERLRQVEGASAETRCWRDLAALGWLGLGLPEEVGGAGGGLVEDALLHLEFGRFLVSPGVMAAALGARLALAAGDPALARRIVAGACRIGLCRGVLDGDGSAQGEMLLAAADGAPLLLCWGRQGAALIETVQLSPLPPPLPLDATVPLARAAASGAAPLRYVAIGEAPIDALAGLLLAAQLAGIAQEAGALAVQHATVREQFGRPIGSFQAVAHHCANMAMRSRAARAQVLAAAMALQAAQADAPAQLAAAGLLAGEAATGNAALAIRVHGAMGFTAEAPLHHLLKRAHLLLAFSAGRAAHRAALLA